MNNSRTEIYDALHNPPAFPTDTEHQPNCYVVHLEGMTLRDYFAAKAMQALITRNRACHPADAYEMADAMLEARQAGKEAA